MIKILYHCL
jgi:hypothetical protein